MTATSEPIPPIAGNQPHYCIRVAGTLDPTWSDRLGGMRITTRSRRDHQPVTTLNGRVRDQAALVGVLNTLYELHLTILSVECDPAREGQDAR